MRLNWRSIPAAMGLVVLASVPVRGQADDDSIALSEVPALVRQAAQRAGRDVRFTKAYKEIDEGQTYYEIAGRDASGRDVEIELTARGQVLTVETEITTREVPRAVLDALKAKARGMRFTSVEEVTKADQLVGYEFEGQNAEGDDVEVNVSADGRSVEVEVDDED